MAAQITTFPITSYHFGTASIYFLIANVLIVPLVSPLTATGIPLVIIASLVPAVGQLFIIPFTAILYYIILVADTISRWPSAQVQLPAIPLTGWLLYASFLLILAYHLNRRPR